MIGALNICYIIAAGSHDDGILTSDTKNSVTQYASSSDQVQMKKSEESCRNYYIKYRK